jgi:hypothetical protein
MDTKLRWDEGPGYVLIKKAKKPYHCHICGREIHPGEKYGRWFVAFNGSRPLCIDCTPKEG